MDPTVAVSRLQAAVASAIEDAGPDRRTILHAFIVALETVATCSWCDFLHWDPKELKLLPLVSSNDNADLARLFRSPYKKGEGITGSALLLRRASRPRYVGTNNFAHDPRASYRHAKEYVAETGPISDYWVFPVFDGEEIYGAFRVVNRLSTHTLAGVPWSVWMLRELEDVALWMEQELVPQVRVPTASSPAKPLPRREEWKPARVIAELEEFCALHWAAEGFLANVIEHVRSVAFRRVEKTSLGCCIGVFGVDSVPQVLDLPEYKTFGQSRPIGLEEQSYAYRYVSPSQGMFVYSGSGDGAGVVSLKSENYGTGWECARRLTERHEHACVFALDREQDCIRVFSQGQLIADYYLSDETGLWRLRVYPVRQAEISANLPAGFAPRVVTEVFAKVVSLSYRRIGSLIVLAQQLPTDIPFEGGSAELIYLDSLNEEEFADIARIDGAMVIGPNSAISRWGSIIGRFGGEDPREVDERDPSLGARHRAGMAVSAHAPDALIFVVSENRPISAIRAGKFVFKKQ